MKRSLLVSTALGLAAVGSILVLMTASSVAAGTLPTLTLALTKNTVTVGGSEVSGAVNIVTTVSGEASDSPALILLKPGVTVAEFGQVVSHLGNDTPLDAIDPYATIVFDGSATEGAPSTAEAVLPAGTYVAVNNGNGFAPFTVTQSSAPATLPTPGATVSAIDFGFRGADTLHDGELVRFQNEGYLIHMIVYGRMKSAADATKAEALLLKGKLKGAGKLYLKGPEGQFAGPLSSGSMQQEVITQPPGVYVILCEMNAEDGRDHYQLGMFRTIRIVK
ncbi:MAG: hypothetical protein ACLPTJ_16160 [Solirubrobacteraceae bacterium]